MLKPLLKLSKKTLSVLLAIILSFLLLAGAAYAADEPVAIDVTIAAPSTGPSDWALSELLDAEALGILPTNWEYTATLPVSAAQATEMLTVFMAKIAALELKPVADNASSASLTVTAETISRGDWLELIYAQIISYEFPFELTATQGMVDFMAEINVLRGVGGGIVGYQLERECTVQEALLFAVRAVSFVYDSTGQSSQGLLWRASDSDTSVYLLGTIHLGAANIYPFSNDLRNIITRADAAFFEVDFANIEGMAYYAANSMYNDGTTLKDHIKPELYQLVTDIYAEFGVTEDMFLPFRPWAIAGEISNLSFYKDVSDPNAMPMVIDVYVYYKALLAGVLIGEIEGYAYQTDLFNSMSDEMMADYLASSVEAFYYEGTDDELASYSETMQAVLHFWQKRDVESFLTVFPKDDVDDELSKLLFEERDEHMAAFVQELLDGEGGTYLIVVGAGHMIGDAGIVQRLLDAGYTAELVLVQ